MKKIIPFSKDIEFDTNVAEINSISLEHTLKLKEENLVSGEFIVSGTYKMTDTSLNTDNFEYKIPFDISIDKKYDTKDIDIDINDFYYEVINNKILSINIEVSIDGLKEKEEKEVVEEPEVLEETLEDDSLERKESEESAKSIFEDLEENERYSVYKVHVVTENDTIENILQKYEVRKEELEAYNGLKDMQIGGKLVIPSHEN